MTRFIRIILFLSLTLILASSTFAITKVARNLYVVDVYGGGCAVNRFGCYGGDCRVFRSLVILDDKAIVDVHFAVVNTYALVLAVADDEIPDCDFGTKRIDSVVVNVRGYSAGQRA